MRAEALGNDVVLLEPLSVEHAEEMAPVLADARLYQFIGGEPPSVADLHGRYAKQVSGHSPDGKQWWLNWVVRRRVVGSAAGYVQATVDPNGAELAWVIGVQHQGQGLARESIRLVVDWLRGQGVSRLIAHVHPDHAASAAVARSAGLSPTGTVEDGEQGWEGSTA